MEEFASDMLADHGFGLSKHVPEWMRPYVSIDFEQLGRDMAMDLHVADAGGGRIWVFETDV